MHAADPATPAAQRPAERPGNGRPSAVAALILREVSTQYGRMAGGYLWAVAEPVAGILLLAAVFSVAFVAPPLGGSFALFYATGLVPFLAYLDLSGKIGQSIAFSRPLLAYPRITFLDVILARFLLNALIQSLVAVIIFAVLILGMGLGRLGDAVPVLQSVAMILALSAGVGVANCALTLRFPVWSQIWSIANRPLFLISGIFFLVEDVPEPYAAWLWWNPLCHVIGALRSGIFPGYNAAWVAPGYVMGVGFCLMILGFLGLLRWYRSHVHR